MKIDEIQRALLSKGYFPRELPPAFTTENFGHHSQEILSEWEKKGVFRITKAKPPKTELKASKRGAYTYQLTAADPEILSKPKKGYERRNLHITHPVPQSLLARELAESWISVQKWLSRREFSEDVLQVSERFERSVKGINFSLHRAKTSYLEATSDWIVKTDITRFYPSIYTHSIAWAAYGKDRVKGKVSLYSGSLADRLDLLVRSCNRNQTVGIPIGPETSRIIAEIISARIDEEFKGICERIRKTSVDRLQDDWTVGVASLEEAEKIIPILTSIYGHFGLEINGSKTSIERIVGRQMPSWISEISGFLSHRPGPLAGARLRGFLAICLRLQADNHSDPVINYALSVIENYRVDRDDVKDMESFLMKAAVASPASMDRICRIVLNLQHFTKRIDQSRMSERFCDLVDRNYEMGHTYEVLWLLYTLRGFRRPVKLSRLCQMVETTQSSAIALIMLDMKNKGMGLATLPTDEWTSRISDDSISSDWTWLLGYEGFRHGWLQDRKSLLTKVLFRPLVEKGVAFYDETKNVPNSRKVAQMRRQRGKADQREIRLLFQMMRGQRSV